MTSRCDLHVHSRHSDRPAEWYLERIGAPESFTDPLAVYRTARARGMSFVTISDHDSIAGSLAIAHLPDTFLSSEETVAFPEDGCEIHLLVHGVTEAQHRELVPLRRDLYAFRDLLRAERIPHVVAHPLFRVNDRLTVDHLEKLLVLFRAFEGINGTRDPRATELFDAVLAATTPDLLAALAERHGLPLEAMEDFATTGGSDDHGGLYVATTWTETPDSASVEEYLDHLRAGRLRRAGEAGSSLKLARSLQTLAHDYYRAKVLGGSRWRNDPFADLLRRIAAGELDPQNPEGTAFGRSVRKILAFAPPGPPPRLPRPIEPGTRAREVEAALAREDERRIFDAACRLGQRAAARALEKAVSELEAGDFLGALPALADLMPAAVALAPYLAAFRFQHQDEPLHRAVADRFPAAAHLRGKSPRVAWATDTLFDLNGVSRTVESAARLARTRSLPLTLLACDGARRRFDFDCECFSPIWETPLPRYEELSLRVPPVVEVVEHCEREAYGRLVVSTPGPMGLAALLAAKLLGLPVSGIYHTDFPRYVAALAGPGRLPELARSFVRWFYRQMDDVFVSSRSYAGELVEMGIEPERLRHLPHGVDCELFDPARRDAGFFTARGLAGEGPVLLYVGRTSREKNLDALFAAFAEVRRRGLAARLALVGDGPDRRSLEVRHAEPGILFTGALSGEELATAYASADLFVFPSRTDTFGNAVLEAMASGLPTLVSQDGGPAEQICHGDDGLVIDLDRPAALADAIELLLRHPELARRLGAAARATARERSWDRLLATLLPESAGVTRLETLAAHS